jgi:hypothetical protein
MGRSKKTVASFDGALLAYLLACIMLLAPMVLYPAGLISFRDLNPGFFVFFAWTSICVAAVIRQRMLLWAALCAGPLIGLSFDWLKPMWLEDGFGFFPWGSIALFCGVALVTAATGVLSIVRTTRLNGSQQPPADIPSSAK